MLNFVPMNNTAQNASLFDISSVFQKPLIIGASVSADYSAPSPGKNLALRYTNSASIRTEASNGRPGRDTLKLLKDSDYKDRSIVIGVDLFFWDSTLSSVDESITAFHRLMKQVITHDIPIVLGEIPELLWGKQPHYARLNHEMAKACAHYAKCFIMPFEKILHQIVEDNHLIIKGRQFEIHELVPDGLHLSSIASDYLADLMLKLMTSLNSGLK